MVTDVWDLVVLAVDRETTVADLKQQALARAMQRSDLATDDYVVKFRGGAVLDEAVSLGSLSAGANAAFIVLPARRRPVR